MNQVAFLLDEHIDPAVQDAIHRAEPALQVRRIGEGADDPPKGTLDPMLLIFAEENRLCLVTFDKHTLPRHVADHLATSRHTWGVMIFPNGRKLSPGRIAEELVMIWGTSSADEWIDRVEYLPY